MKAFQKYFPVLVVALSTLPSLRSGERGILASVEEIESVVCVDGKASSVLVELRLRFTNSSMEPVVIPKLWKEFSVKVLSGGDKVVSNFKLPADPFEPDVMALEGSRPTTGAGALFVTLPGHGTYLGHIFMLIPWRGRRASLQSECELSVRLRPWPRLNELAISGLQEIWGAPLYVGDETVHVVRIHPSQHEPRHCNDARTVGHDDWLRR